MEKNNSLSKTLKDKGVSNNGTAVNKGHVHHPRLCPSRTPWTSYGSSQMYGRSSEDNYLCGISWPPRSYACSFCKREFRSAQALGGHMNVHRRDRARLRQSSPPEDFHHHQHPPILSLTSPSPSPSPNPNPNATASSTCPSRFASSCPLISQSSAAPSLRFLASRSMKEVKGAEKSLLASWRLKGTASKTKPVMTEASVRAQEMEERYKYFDNNTEMDLLKGIGDAYIDLELRLGCP